MSLTSSRSSCLFACAASAWLALGCGHKHHGETAVSAGGDGGTSRADAGHDAGPKGTIVPPNVTPPKDAGHDATPPGGGAGTSGGDEDAGPTCNGKVCRATSDECNVAYCDRATGSCVLAPKMDGTPCGSRTLDNCTAPDSCEAGVCVSHDSPKGTACGDQGVACHYDDQCDGKGNCADKGVFSSGAPCGDQTSTECDAPDTCDSLGFCLKNWVPADTACGDQNIPCRYNDSCDGQGQCADYGFWTPGACPPGVTDTPSGCVCGNDILNVCQFAVDLCVAGTCMLGREPDGMPCGDTSTNTECDKPDSCQSGLCSKRYVQNGTTCGNSAESTCDHADSCDGAGKCDPRYESVSTSCGNATDCQAAAMCSGSGSCAPGAFAQPGTHCGSQTSTACDAPDTCNASGVCQSNFASPGSACGDQGLACANNDSCDGNGGCTDKGVISPCQFSGTVSGGSSGLAGIHVETLGSGAVSTTTGPSGSYQLSLPLNQQVMLHVQDSTGYFGLVEPITLSVQDAQYPLDFSLDADSVYSTPASAVGGTLDLAKGVVVVNISGSSVTGAEGATLSAASALPITNTGSGWQQSGTIMAAGSGFLQFYNVATGTTTVTLTSPSVETCVPDAGASAVFAVFAHTRTLVNVTCH